MNVHHYVIWRVRLESTDVSLDCSALTCEESMTDALSL